MVCASLVALYAWLPVVYHNNTYLAWLMALVVGIALTLLERALPKYKKYLPSAMGIGLGMILPYNICISMCLGAIIAAIASRKEGSRAAELVIPVASGLIAGQSVVGVVVAGINNFVLN